MSQAVTAEQISALLRSPRSGERSEDSAPAAQRRLPRLRTVNFSRPTKFTSDQERRLSRLLESFCRTASSRLSAELRVGIELEVIAATQLTWSSALAQVPAGSVCAIVDAKPIDTRLLLTAELPYVLCGIEALLGAPPGNTPRERRLTDIDWTLARRLFGTMLGQLSLIWQDVADVELTLGGLEATTENAQVAPFSEPTLALTLEARVGRTSTTLSLLIPYCAIAPVASSFSQLDGAGQEGDGAGTEIDGALRGVSIDMRAEVADTHMTVDEVLALRPGDVVSLDASASAGVTVYADEVPVHRARPGRSGRRRAVQILGPVEDGSWASPAH
jgi:flagellar motor switch protein FliM